MRIASTKQDAVELVAIANKTMGYPMPLDEFEKSIERVGGGVHVPVDQLPSRLTAAVVVEREGETLVFVDPRITDRIKSDDAITKAEREKMQSAITATIDKLIDRQVDDSDTE
jgi:hypothetical protein